MDITAADVLEQTADKFESDEYNWISFSDLTAAPRGLKQGKCAAMGIRRVAGRENFDTGTKALTAMGDHLGVDSVVEWNDAPGRTRQEVIDAMKETAKGLRNKS